MMENMDKGQGTLCIKMSADSLAENTTNARPFYPLNISAVGSVPCFSSFNHYFYKKLSLYIHIPNTYLGLGFEFGPQRIRDLAFMSILQYIEYASTILNNLFFSFKRSNQML